ncbi:MAG: HAD family phosphatase [Inquilinus sp.]|nr:HAD family phosphatase [Inquilinus sp.]
MPDTATIPVFDIGGVLLDWNPRYLYRTLFDDEAAMEEFLATVCTPAWNRQMDGGKPFAQGVAELTARFPEHAALIAAFDERWQEMIPRAHTDTVAILDELRGAGRPVYAITNFSAEKLDLELRRWPFLGGFEGIIVSGAERVLKPGPEIYRLLLDRYGLTAADCLFIDDVEENAAGARAVGMHAVRFESADRLRGDLAAHGLL